jgi:hypothetical protein
LSFLTYAASCGDEGKLRLNQTELCNCPTMQHTRCRKLIQHASFSDYEWGKRSLKGCSRFEHEMNSELLFLFCAELFKGKLLQSFCTMRTIPNWFNFY